MHNRFDLLGPVHKGLRHALHGLCFQAGAMDIDDARETRAFAEEFHRIAIILESHSRDEDAHVHHLYESFAPETAAKLEAEHETLDAELRALQDLVKTGAAEPSADRRAELWYDVRRRLTRFAAGYLQHLEREEGEGAEVLWANLTDAQLKEVSVNIRSSIPPSTMMIFLHYMMPALTFKERYDMLSGMKQFAPKEAYEAVRALAEDRLSPRDWEALRSRLDATAAS
ncbi:hemerythrin domain-containing protein [Paenibacillus sp.]|uniref:hemerythrin domain-containing protein n=1 Tax=Paenibacillus sp. TaxID=58172 RepID=UPI002D376415|nr:hemerythrin domain-containing protein [Paenibacillus sp.]HZG58878.1 hemerythrin domain-containing protein [Paenibacillus sp.]